MLRTACVILACLTLAAAQSCSSITFCDACIATGECGWCGGSATCIPSTAASSCGMNFYDLPGQCTPQCSQRRDSNGDLSCVVCPDLYNPGQLWYGSAASVCNCTLYTTASQCVLGDNQNCGWCDVTNSCQPISYAPNCPADQWTTDPCKLLSGWDACNTAGCAWCNANSTCSANTLKWCPSDWLLDPPCSERTALPSCVLQDGDCGWCADTNLCTQTQGTCSLSGWRNSSDIGCAGNLTLPSCTMAGCTWCNSTGLCIDNAAPCTQPIQWNSCADVLDPLLCVGWEPCEYCSSCVAKSAQACNSPSTSPCDFLDSAMDCIGNAECAWCSLAQGAGCDVKTCGYKIDPPCEALTDCNTCTSAYKCYWCGATDTCLPPSSQNCPYEQRLYTDCKVTNTSESCPTCIQTQFSLIGAQPATWCASSQRCQAPNEPCEVPYAFGCGGDTDCSVFPMCQNMRNSFDAASPFPCGWCWGDTSQAFMGAPHGPTNSSLCPTDKWTFSTVPCGAALPKIPIVAATFGLIAFYTLMHLVLGVLCSRRKLVRHSIKIPEHYMLEEGARYKEEEETGPVVRFVYSLFEFGRHNGIYMSFFFKKAVNIAMFSTLVYSVSMECSAPIPVAIGSAAAIAMTSTFPIATWSAYLSRHPNTFPLFNAVFLPLWTVNLVTELGLVIAMLVLSVPYMQISTDTSGLVGFTPISVDTTLDAARFGSLAVTALISASSYFFVFHQRRLLALVFQNLAEGKHLSLKEAARATDPAGPVGRHLAMQFKRTANGVVCALAVYRFYEWLQRGTQGTTSMLFITTTPTFALVLISLVAFAIGTKFRGRVKLGPIRLLYAYFVVLQIGALGAFLVTFAGNFVSHPDAMIIFFCILSDLADLPYFISLSLQMEQV